jgi:hypothetical protein
VSLVLLIAVPTISGRLIERHDAANAKHDGATVVVELDRCQATCGNSRHKRFCVNCRVADSDSVGLASHTDVGDIILLPVVASLPALQPTDDIVIAGVIHKEGALTNRYVTITTDVADERITTDGGVAIASVIVIQCEISDTGIIDAGSVEHHRTCSIRGVPRPRRVQDERGHAAGSIRRPQC